MLIVSHRQRVSRSLSPQPRRTPRRGVALVFVLVFVIAMAALAMSSIFMASNSNLLAKSYDRERDLRSAADAALAIGKARVNSSPSLLTMAVGQTYKQILINQPIMSADSSYLPGIVVNVWVGPTGTTSGQNGRFASIVAQALDTRGGSNAYKNGQGFIRRLELTQESFAKFAYWSNSETNNGYTIYFNNGDQLWGPVWSNDVISIGTGGASFHDNVGTAKTISGKSNGTFTRPPVEGQPLITLPSTSALSVLSGYASTGGTSITAQDGPNADETQVQDRIEFIAFDTNADKDSTGDDEGFYRYYKGNSGTEQAVRGDWPGVGYSVPSISSVDKCGDWHYEPGSGSGVAGDTARLKFYPASVHNTSWFWTKIDAGLIARGSAKSSADAYATSEQKASLSTILTHANARCYLAGDPHLVSTDRPIGGVRSLPAVGVYLTTDVQKGGEDTTFTPIGKFGAWQPVTQTTANVPIKSARPWDGLYLQPLTHLYNNNYKGVIYSSGNLGVSGVLNGQVTLYAKGVIVILDDLRYANDPVKSVCHDILGLITDYDVVVADNALNTPPSISDYANANLDDTKDIYIHSVIMALGTSFRVENYDSGPTNVNNCDAVSNGRGCIYLSGGLIQKNRGAVGTSSGSGYSKRYTYDHCAIVNPPPYFPTTGRFQDNRYLELDPAGFDALTYFKSTKPSGP
jgi:hypothetical protein